MCNWAVWLASVIKRFETQQGNKICSTFTLDPLISTHFIHRCSQLSNFFSSPWSLSCNFSQARLRAATTAATSKPFPMQPHRRSFVSPSRLWRSPQQGCAPLHWLHNGALCCQGFPPPPHSIQPSLLRGRGIHRGHKGTKTPKPFWMPRAVQPTWIEWEEFTDLVVLKGQYPVLNVCLSSLTWEESVTNYTSQHTDPYWLVVAFVTIWNWCFMKLHCPMWHHEEKLFKIAFHHIFVQTVKNDKNDERLSLRKKK